MKFEYGKEMTKLIKLFQKLYQLGWCKNQNLSSYWSAGRKTSLENIHLGSHELVSSYKLFSEQIPSILPLKIKRKRKAKWWKTQIYRNPGCFSACSVSLLLVTLVTEITVTRYLTFPQSSPVSTARCLQGKVSIPGQQFFCMYKKAEAKSTVETLQAEAICLMV